MGGARLGAYLAWKYLIGGLLLLWLLTTYVYLGNSVFWSFVNLTGRNLLLPLRWPAIRGEFRKQLELKLHQELDEVYAHVPGDVARALLAERQQVEKLAGETQEVATWLKKREQSSGIEGLYGD